MAPGEPDIEHDQPAPDAVVEQIDRAPFGFVEHDAAAQRREDGAEPRRDQAPRRLRQAQRQHRRDIAEAVDERRRVARLRLVLRAVEADHHPIEADEYERDQRIAHQRGDAGRQREQEYRGDRPDQAHRVLQIDELVLREAEEGAARLLHALDGFAGMMVLVPVERQAGHFDIERIGEALADADGDKALEHARRAVQRPARDAGEEDERHVPRRGAERLVALGLHGFDRGAGQIGDRQLQRLRDDQQRHEQDHAALIAGGIVPERAVEPGGFLPASIRCLHCHDRS